MIISDSLVKKLLKQSERFTAEQVKDFVAASEDQKLSLQEYLIQNNIISDHDLTSLYGQEIDVPYADFSAPDLNRDVLQLIPERIARQYRSIAFNMDSDGVVYVAMEDPDDIQAISFLQKQMGRPVRVHIATSTAIQAAIEQYSGSSVTSELAKVIAIDEKEDAEQQVADEDVAEDSPIAKTLDLIIDYGIKARASDIHIEPREDQVIIRYRIDGVLHAANKLPHKLLAALTSRIKILSNLKIDEHRAPQDGRFKISVNDHVYALRVSTLPIIDGEKVVMRILDESSKAASLDQLGYWGKSLEELQKAIKLPHGLILVTGPTGSGKSTSLFSVLSGLNDPTVNISTIEDPVEYRISGVNQTQINPIAGMTFASGLRSLLRQDPNIIMVGEVRDGETADLAVQAALTGHLVFSTLHTNNAATCLPRLLDMGVEPFLIASTVRVVIGQRLVRRLCPECKQSYDPDEAVLERIEEALGIDSKNDLDWIHKLEEQAMRAGIGVEHSKDEAPELASTQSGFKKLFKANPNGCSYCNNTGYHGRLGVYEVLSNTEDIQKLIITNTTSEEIEKQAINDGMISMQIDGFIKALRGETTLEEIMRVTSDEV